MKHQLKEDIRDQYIYGILNDSGERIMPTLDQLIKKHGRSNLEETFLKIARSKNEL